MTNMTIREIRKELFDTDKYTVIGSTYRTNKESRDYLYNKENQDENTLVITRQRYLMIYE